MCEKRANIDNRKQIFNRAHKIQIADHVGGWIWSPTITDGNEGYFDSIETFLDYLHDNPELERPDWVQGCITRAIINPTVENIMDPCYDDAYDDWEHDGSGIDDLSAALEKFRAVNNRSRNDLHYPDTKLVIMIPPVKGDPV